jgi:hypothetical protein
MIMHINIFCFLWMFILSIVFILCVFKSIQLCMLYILWLFSSLWAPWLVNKISCILYLVISTNLLSHFFKFNYRSTIGPQYTLKNIISDQFVLVQLQYSDFLKFVGPSGQKITRTGNTAKYASPGVRQKFLFVYFVLNRKCNWYAGTITVNSELDSASNDIYF